MTLRFDIAERLRPFSHLPGVCCLLPGSSFRLKIFPTLLQIDDLTHTNPKRIAEIPLKVKGPVKDFTVQQDLERGVVNVWGEGIDGFFRYRLAADRLNSHIHCAVFRGVPFELDASPSFFHFKEGPLSLVEPHSNDRLSLGNHKKQDWELVCRRSDLTEIFPIWNRLGAFSSDIEAKGTLEGTAFLLESIASTIRANKPELLEQPFLSLFQAGFEGILSPRLIDDSYQGIIPSLPIIDQTLSPLMLLTAGRKLIHTLFWKGKEDVLSLLPHLPPQFHCGRLLQVDWNGQMTFDMEWSKKIIRRMIVHAHYDFNCQLNLKHVKSFRMRRHKKDRGERLLVGTTLRFEKNVDYFFDNFE